MEPDLVQELSAVNQIPNDGILAVWLLNRFVIALFLYLCADDPLIDDSGRTDTKSEKTSDLLGPESS